MMGHRTRLSREQREADVLAALGNSTMEVREIANVLADTEGWELDGIWGLGELSLWSLVYGVLDRLRMREIVTREPTGKGRPRWRYFKVERPLHGEIADLEKRATRTGLRGGNVRDLDTARALQSTHKPDYVALVDQALLEALFAGQLHADDLADLELPPEHLNLIGTRIARLVNKRLIHEVGRRKGTSPASNGRKSGMYELTPKGRKLMPATVGVRAEGRGEPPSSIPGAADATSSSDPGGSTAAGTPACFQPAGGGGESAAPARFFETSTNPEWPGDGWTLIWSWVADEPPAYWRRERSAVERQGQLLEAAPT